MSFGFGAHGPGFRLRFSVEGQDSQCSIGLFNQGASGSLRASSSNHQTPTLSKAALAKLWGCTEVSKSEVSKPFTNQLFCSASP